VAFVGVSAAILGLSFAFPELSLTAFQAGMVGSIWGALAKEAALGSSFYLGSSAGSSEKNETITALMTNSAKGNP